MIPKQDLIALSQAATLDASHGLVIELARVMTALPDGARRGPLLWEIAEHLGYLLQGKVNECRALRDNIHALCPPELAKKIVQD